MRCGAWWSKHDVVPGMGLSANIIGRESKPFYERKEGAGIIFPSFLIGNAHVVVR